MKIGDLYINNLKGLDHKIVAIKKNKVSIQGMFKGSVVLIITQEMFRECFRPIDLVVDTKPVAEMVKELTEVLQKYSFLQMHEIVSGCNVAIENIDTP
jgi:hypothetical protein